MLMYQSLTNGNTTVSQEEAIKMYEKGHDVLVLQQDRKAGRMTKLALWEGSLNKKNKKNLKKAIDKLFSVW